MSCLRFPLDGPPFIILLAGATCLLLWLSARSMGGKLPLVPSRHRALIHHGDVFFDIEGDHFNKKGVRRCLW